MSRDRATSKALPTSVWGMMPMAVVWQLGEKPKETIMGATPIGGRVYEFPPD